jgi:hypothetical protein
VVVAEIITSRTHYIGYWMSLTETFILKYPLDKILRVIESIVPQYPLDRIGVLLALLAICYCGEQISCVCSRNAH